MEIRWDVSKEDASLILDIAQRAEPLFARQGLPFNRAQFVMDVTAVHRNGCPLKLRDLLASEALDFSHDIAGIRKHINRATGQLARGFLPRCAA